MKALFGKLIHLLIMPCSRVPLLIEQRNAGKLPLIARMRLNAHLLVCKWCAAYVEKVERIDKLLTKKYEEEKSFEDTEIQSFKDNIKKK
ncbi:hypothetical protein [Prevotella sp. OH937_COT-195]|uniref:hypothetical protein n=1 Tax=Prevotella sp. OH937_COT-195 TaxID=2491051 RepID=UPI000F651769|nr:hypothetical protein [Prevotella sp. OH937_COT-195]RRD02655.1 hypothetical protein EII32_01165 [Prevotella sp. OH937_COT-195]